MIRKKMLSTHCFNHLEVLSFEIVFNSNLTNKITEANFTSTGPPNFHFHLTKGKSYLSQVIGPGFFCSLLLSML